MSKQNWLFQVAIVGQFLNSCEAKTMQLGLYLSMSSIFSNTLPLHVTIVTLLWLNSELQGNAVSWAHMLYYIQYTGHLKESEIKNTKNKLFKKNLFIIARLFSQ